MLTDDFGFRVLEVDHAERSLRLRVHVIRYDIQQRSHLPIPQDAGLFLKFLWEAATDSDPIRDEVAPAQVQDDDWVVRNVQRFVELAEAGDQDRASLDGTEFELLDGDFHHERDGDWPHEFLLAQADFRIQVTETRWLQHLEPGQVLGSASRDAATEHLRAEDVPHLPDFRSPAVALTPFPADRADSGWFEDDEDEFDEDDEFDEEAEEGVADQLVFSDDSRYLAVTSEDGDLVVYETDGWTECVRTHPGRRGLDALIWVPGKHVVVLSDAYGIYEAEPWAYDVDAGEAVEAPEEAGHVRSRTGRYRVEFGENGSVAFVTTPMTPDRTMPVGPDDEDLLSTDDVAFDAAESLMFVCRGPNVYVLDPATGDLLNTITAGVRRLGSVAASPDGAYVVTAPHTRYGFVPWPPRPEVEGREAGDEPSVWRVADGRPLLHCKIGLNVEALAWSPDGRWLAANVDGAFHPSDPVQTYVFRVPS